MSRAVPKAEDAEPGGKERSRRLVMRWQKDDEGRLFCTWTSEPGPESGEEKRK